tara:strand:- start:374 stop:709 length:336 start_codon:yes stop_codon:yes gene_type:complete
MTWLLKLRKVPLLGWLVAIIAVLTASLIWSVRAASYRERQLRVNMQISSTRKSHEKALDKIGMENKLARSKIVGLEIAEVAQLEKKRTEIRKAARESNAKLTSMVNDMFKK